jgi:hypothetical protein
MRSDVRALAAIFFVLLLALQCEAIGVEQVECDDKTMTLVGHVDGPATILERQPWEADGGSEAVHTKTGPFHIEVPRFSQGKDRAYCSFVTVDAKGKPICVARYVQTVGGSIPSQELYPQAASKKGLQVADVADALALGIKHAGLNVPLGQFIDLDGGSDSIAFKTQGRTFYFRRGSVLDLDQEVKKLSDHGVIITLIIYLRAGDPTVDTLMLHPHYSKDAPNHVSAFNVTDQKSTEQLEACFEFFASRYSMADHRYGRAVNFIVGNEVDSQWYWYNMGTPSLATFIDQYARAVRLCHTAVRKFSSNDRVFISLDHFWNMHFADSAPGHAFPGREIVEGLQKFIAEQGDIDWNIAYHPYPEDLFNPRFWLDKTATHDANTLRITFKNIEMLPQFLRSPQMLYEGQPRHVILSEQGFHTPSGPDGEAVQAAAFAYAWVRVNRTAGIDAFILHRQIDAPEEGGLHLGLWWSPHTNPNGHERQKKKIYDVFQAADTDHWEKAFQFALPIIGQTSWDAAP